MSTGFVILVCHMFRSYACPEVVTQLTRADLLTELVCQRDKAWDDMCDMYENELQPLLRKAQAPSEFRFFQCINRFAGVQDNLDLLVGKMVGPKKRSSPKSDHSQAGAVQAGMPPPTIVPAKRFKCELDQLV